MVVLWEHFPLNAGVASVESLGITQEHPLHPVRKYQDTQVTDVYGLPSWAFNLTQSSQVTEWDLLYLYNIPLNLTPKIFDMDEHVAKANRIAPIASFSTDMRALHIAGVHLGTIAETTGDMMYSVFQEDWSCFVLPASTLYDIYHRMLRPRDVST
ncbi:hypothetical protein EJ02DRAFT_471603 [Clathrospora elynae]|uniref:Uncharacterized protein n=1 Tax=Clathrospora elynae TaxID=706981 RepID=A0A6A5S2C8_9PLEO|nr:hypothetical protein EJ02DRAFT_471603 [Clathrospora elynae]